ncbi:MAG: hypothetical protein CVU08_12780 [Bacteroidetes bacterium HGW-Bacteroidetes-3]|nr:MAG: hypothetical protein CVU08_12780 [Bacteroidetes bacterium HGW-Bacteroidetes-3]
MLKNATYKQKFLAVVVGFLLLLFASYKKTFKDTIAVKKELNNIEYKLLNIKNSFSDIYNLKNDITTIDNIIGGYTVNPDQVQQMILDFITKRKFNLNIVSIADVHLFSDEEFLIYSNQIEIEGSYETLVNLLYEIEKNFKYSRVISTQFYSKQNFRTNTKQLYLKILFQNYEKIK